MRANLTSRLERSEATRLSVLAVILLGYVTTLVVASQRDQKRQPNDPFVSVTNDGRSSDGFDNGARGRKTMETLEMSESTDEANTKLRHRSSSSQKITTVRNEVGSGKRAPKNADRIAENQKPIITFSQRNESQRKISSRFVKNLPRKRVDFSGGDQKRGAPQQIDQFILPSTISNPSKVVTRSKQVRRIASTSEGSMKRNQARGSASTQLTTTTTHSTPATTTAAPITTKSSSNSQRYKTGANDLLFGFIPKTVWYLSRPPATTSAAPFQRKITKKHQKKYTLSTTKFQDEPFRVDLTTTGLGNYTRNNPKSNELAGIVKDKRSSVQMMRGRFSCPRESEVRFQLFPKICKIDKDCSVWKRDEICCEIFGAKSCVDGIPKPLEEAAHNPLLGLIPRKCPIRPLAELWWDVKECETDNDCWPRVCCPDGQKRYCRTSEPVLEVVPVPVPVKRSFHYLTEYLECTPPPPPIFDLHPKPCGSTFDCFPNVCCQEAGKRHCRPPKKSVLTLMANILNVGFVKRLIQNIVIK